MLTGNIILNLDPRSVYENTEIGVVVESLEIARYMAEIFDANIAASAFRLELHAGEDGYRSLRWSGYENGKERLYTVDPHTGFRRRLVPVSWGCCRLNHSCEKPATEHNTHGT
jgi:putative cardiolipin synthase